MKHTLCALLALALLASCHRGGDADAGHPYQVNATFEVDSTIVLDHLMLYTDSHRALKSDTLELSHEKTLSHEGLASGLDELYLCSDQGELCRFYATGGMLVDVALRVVDDSLRVSFAESATDSINPWLMSQRARFEMMPKPRCLEMMDSLCHVAPSDIRCTLLLRDVIAQIGDSVGVRRCLGALTDEAKPEWLIGSINYLLDQTAPSRQRKGRLPGIKMQVNDTIAYDLSLSRSEYLLVYCWADYSTVSIDSLHALQALLKEEYDYKRVKMLSVCVSAPDSSWWREQRGEMDEWGMNAYFPAGLSDQRLRSWDVNRVPSLFIIDMYSNLQDRDIWGEKLRKQLDRIPNKSGFAHTPKVKPTKKNNGR